MLALFESRRRAKEEQEKKSQQAVERGWALVGSYQLELIDDLFEVYGVEGDADPYEDTQIEVDLRERSGRHWPDRLDPSEDPFPPLAPPPPQRVREVVTEADSAEVVSAPKLTPLDLAQRRVVEALHLASRGWFGFFFRTIGGTDFERREIASRNLADASKSLTKISKDLSEADLLPHLTAPSGRFRTAIEGWADAFDAISRGMMLDQQHVASRGLELMQQATDIAANSGIITHSADAEATEAFEYLLDLKAPEGASKSAARRAKEPWRRAIKAASSAPKAKRGMLDRRG